MGKLLDLIFSSRLIPGGSRYTSNAGTGIVHLFRKKARTRAGTVNTADLILTEDQGLKGGTNFYEALTGNRM